MPLIAKMPEADGNYPLAPAGTHVAVCVQVIDKGHQFSDKWQKWEHKVMLGWELTDADSDGDDMEHAVLVFSTLTLTLGRKSNLRPLLEGWRGKAFTEEEANGFDIAKLLGAPCLLSVIHETSQANGQVYANVKSASKLPKNTPKPTATSNQLLFIVDEPDWTVFGELGENTKASIKNSREMKEADNGQPAPVDPATVTFSDDDSIPF